MIAKVSSCRGGTALFGYVINDKKGFELDRNFISGQTPKEMYDEMKIIQNQNHRCVNNTFSMVISPSVNDGNNLSNDDLKDITHDFLELMNKSPKMNQYIAFVHTEKDHKHIHIIMNRIQENSEPMNDKFIGKKAQHAIDQVAKKYGLESAKEIMLQRLNKEKNLFKEECNQIKNYHQEVMKTVPKDFESYQKAMKSKGIDVVPTINKQGNIQGFRLNNLKTENSFKASQIDRNLNLNQLLKQKNINDLSKSFDIEKVTPTIKPVKAATKIIKTIYNDYSM